MKKYKTIKKTIEGITTYKDCNFGFIGDDYMVSYENGTIKLIYMKASDVVLFDKEIAAFNLIIGIENIAKLISIITEIK